MHRVFLNFDLHERNRHVVHGMISDINRRKKRGRELMPKCRKRGRPIQVIFTYCNRNTRSNEIQMKSAINNIQ